jgi:hypothetical protein
MAPREIPQLESIKAEVTSNHLSLGFGLSKAAVASERATAEEPA